MVYPLESPRRHNYWRPLLMSLPVRVFTMEMHYATILKISGKCRSNGDVKKNGHDA